MHSKKAPIYVFAIGEDESGNVDLGYALVKAYGSRESTYLYVFSSEPKAESLLALAADSKMRLRRINEVRAFVYNHLYTRGFSLFEEARDCGDHKKISAVIIGMNRYGFELARALPWFCQMDGYRVSINVFDSSENAYDRFAAACPELIDDEHNGRFDDDGEAQYLLRVSGGFDYGTASFFSAVSAVDDATFVLVDVGSDSGNIRTALDMRRLFERIGLRPRICAVLRSPEETEMLAHVTDYSGNEYRIDFVGDIASSYSADVILNSEPEQAALARHLKWGEEKQFWMYEHNYKSSMASAIHSKMKKLCRLPGAELPPAERSEADKWRYRKLEHRRWNAYMRSEGFVYSGSVEKSSRNNLAKLHNCLVPFDMLTEAEQIKDDD